ncbi:MAG: aminopeptidase P family protein [bacterium]|nr:aminopeptidase P family protein [Candidatus Kapabacteria bacterium]
MAKRTGVASSERNGSRIDRLRAQMKSRSLDAVLVTHLPHIRYLCGFSGSAGLMLVTRNEAVFITDFRYQEQIATELQSGVRAIIDKAPYERMKSDGLIVAGMTVGYQEDNLTVAAFDSIRKKLRKVRFEAAGSLLQQLAMIKTASEIATMRKAATIAARVYTEILEFVQPGMRETDVAAEISYRGRKHGADGDAFDVIVASGPRGALPHGRASKRKIRKGELVTLDFGFRYNGFNSDMTRTFAVGKPSDEARRVYDVVLRAQKKGVAAARAGMSGKALDDVCRDEIVAAGYGSQFGHSTGHGLGIEVHESPYVAAKGGDHILAENMVVTIEPGIYLPGKLGVRIEDDIVIGKDRSRSLTTSPKDLIIV